MSQAFMSRLPLPEPYEVVSRDENALKTWRLVNDWYNFVVEEDDKGKRSDRLLYLSVRLKKEYTKAGSPQQKENPDLVGAFCSVQLACQEVHQNGLFMRGAGGSISSFTIALDAAHAMFGRLFPHHASTFDLPRDQTAADLADLTVCRDFYENLDRYNRYARSQHLGEQVRVMPSILTNRVNGLAAEIADLEARLDKGRKLSQRDDKDEEAKPRAKRARETATQPEGLANEPVRPEIGRKQGQAPHKRPQSMGHGDDTVQPEQSVQAKREILRTLEFDASASNILSFHDAKVVSRGAGLTSLKDFGELVSGGWLSDGVIDPYLAFLCDQKNRQQGTDPVSRNAPEWHAWPTYLYMKTSEGAELPRIWPPQGYPQARFGETRHHLFPMHIDENHWGLAHLAWGGAEWSLDWYSGLPGYMQRFRVQWAGIEKYLKRAWAFECDQTLTIFEPEQPRQGNASDCGVFVLCEARCLITGWPVDTFRQEDMKFMRRRICFELELDRSAN